MAKVTHSSERMWLDVVQENFQPVHVSVLPSTLHDCRSAPTVDLLDTLDCPLLPLGSPSLFLGTT